MLVCALTMADLMYCLLLSGLDQLADGNLVIRHVIFDCFMGLVIVVVRLPCT